MSDNELDIEQSGVVINNIVTAFGKGMSQANRNDIRNCLHYCNLAADKAHPDDDKGTAWYGVFTSALKSFAFFELRDKDERLSVDSTAVTLDGVAVNLIAKAVGGAASAGIQAATVLPLIGDALAGLKRDDNAANLFKDKSRRHNGALFVVAACVESEQGDVYMALGVVGSREATTNTQLLFGNYQSNSTSTYGASTLLGFNPSVYARIREDVLVKLGDKAVGAFAEFPI